MATLLKKRVASEYSTVVQEEAPAKKLKWVLKTSKPCSLSYTLVGLLDTQEKSSNDALQLLNRVSDSLTVQVEEIPIIINRLSNYFTREKEPVVRAFILSIFADIGCRMNTKETNTGIVKTIIERTLFLLKAEKSHRVITQGLITLKNLGKYCPNDYTLHLKIVDKANQKLTGTSSVVKCLCFEIIGEYLPANIIQSNGKLATKMLKQVSEHMHHEDARVRSIIFKTMDVLHTRGFKLDPSMYTKVQVTLKDDYDNVRIAALKILWLLGTSYPENNVSVDPAEELRRVDDAFGQICSSVFDLSVQVRISAVSLLGQMTDVSLRFLEQTLDKKLMSNMKRKRSAHERAKREMDQGKWVAGKGYTQDKPEELVDADQISLISQGACGAFAFGLEDEFLEVRSCTISALRSLAIAHPQFSALAQDFLVDMFNDEIQEVRLKAINSLTNMSAHIVLRLDQLEIILAVLEDSSMDVREGLHRILTSCKFSTKDCLQMAITELLDSLKKYPQDRKSVWKCYHLMGSIHSNLTIPLVPELLGIHPFFDTTEPNVEDPAYICILLLIFNAAQHCHTILQLLEEKTIRHYCYLRDTMPHLVPALPISSSIMSLQPESVSTAALQFLESMLKTIESANNTSVRIGLLETVEKDLAKLSLMDSCVAGTAEFSSLYIRSQLMLAGILRNKLWCSKAGQEFQTSVVKNNVEQLLQNILRMQYLFDGLSNIDIASIKQFKLKTLALLLVYVVRATNQSARALCNYFLTQVDDTNGFLIQNNIKPDAFTGATFKELSLLEDYKPGAVARVLLPVLQNSVPSPPPPPNTNINMTYAVINSPSGTPDMTYKFLSGLIMGVPFDADLYHLNSVKCLRFKIKYADQQTHLIVPRIDHLRPAAYESGKSNMYRLVTTALISHHVWSDASLVEISLALDLTDLEGTTLSHCMHLSNLLCVVDLGKPVKVSVNPKPHRRGI